MADIKRFLKTSELINSRIWYLTLNDVFVWGFYFIATALVGIYLSERIDAPATEVVGIGAGIGYFMRGITQIPIGILGDKIKGRRDEVLFLVLGNLLMGTPIILYTQISAAPEYYLLQVVFGMGCAINLVNWRKLFAGSLDKGHEGMEYAAYGAIMGMSITVLSVLGGTIASISSYYFDLVIGGVGVVIILSNLWLVPLFLSTKD